MKNKKKTIERIKKKSKEWGSKLDIKSNEIKCLETKLRKKINQEKNKNIAIKKMKTIGLKNQIE